MVNSPCTDAFFPTIILLDQCKTNGSFYQKQTILTNNWKRRKIAEHLLSKCSFPVYCALLPILYDLSLFYLYLLPRLYNLSYARILIAARGLLLPWGRPMFYFACLLGNRFGRVCFSRGVCFSRLFFLQSLASGQGLDHLNWTQMH